MLYLRFEVLIPSNSNADGVGAATAHMMFASDDVRECIQQAVSVFRAKQFRVLQLKEAQMGFVESDFSYDERVQRLLEEVQTNEMAWELADASVAEEVDTLSAVRA